VLPEGLGQLSRLESLVFVCPFLRALPENISSLQRLRSLEVSVRGCLTLPGDLWDLKSLEDLKIKCRHLVPATPWALTRMPRLKNLAVKCAAVACNGGVCLPWAASNVFRRPRAPGKGS